MDQQDSTNKKIISSELFKKKQIKLCCVKKISDTGTV